MSVLSKRSTVYLEPEVHQALKIKAASAHQSISEVVNEAVRIALLEDSEDLSAFEERAGESTLSYEELLADLKAHGKL
ncbi:CopG family transcriptional regulator [Candidatus Methylobacter oryzae]|uniref:CopG family transcriptional regulator n=1 Tax=Candidatus Methylobacter oryzae TaxID=2497749 RepID=A0ABY3CEK3_9GAMM|nr:CopG family transcriptional regulator [Candidatus Methylobacter oryzae]TRX01458.1 CopG family transcriptional regulator [Candidatus Methylobacter oryzae]